MLRSFMLMVVMLVLAAVVSHAQPQPQSEAAKLFDEGRRLIAANCGDCQGSTKENLEKGLASVRKAIAAGYPDAVEANRVLAEGLTTQQFVFSAPDSAAQAAVQRERLRVYEQMVKLRPTDPQIAYLYAQAVTDQDAALDAFRRVIWLDPRHAGAHFAIGMIQAQKAQRGDAIATLRLALEFASSAEAEPYGNRLIEVLKEAGRTSDIDEARQLIKRKLK